MEMVDTRKDKKPTGTAFPFLEMLLLEESQVMRLPIFLMLW